MATLFDQETVLNAWKYEMMEKFQQDADRKVRDADQQRREAQKQAEEVTRKSSYALYQNGVPVERISMLLGVPVKKLQEWFENPVN